MSQPCEWNGRGPGHSRRQLPRPTANARCGEVVAAGNGSEDVTEVVEQDLDAHFDVRSGWAWRQRSLPLSCSPVTIIDDDGQRQDCPRGDGSGTAGDSGGDSGAPEPLTTTDTGCALVWRPRRRASGRERCLCGDRRGSKENATRCRRSEVPLAAWQAMSSPRCRASTGSETTPGDDPGEAPSEMNGEASVVTATSRPITPPSATSTAMRSRAYQDICRSVDDALAPPPRAQATRPETLRRAKGPSWRRDAGRGRNNHRAASCRMRAILAALRGETPGQRRPCESMTPSWTYRHAAPGRRRDPPWAQPKRRTESPVWLSWGVANRWRHRRRVTLALTNAAAPSDVRGHSDRREGGRRTIPRRGRSPRLRPERSAEPLLRSEPHQGPSQTHLHERKLATIDRVLPRGAAGWTAPAAA